MNRLCTWVALGAALGLGACASGGQSHHASTALSRGHCTGLSAEEQDATALLAPSNVRRVEPLYRQDEGAVRTRASVRAPRTYLAGATLEVRAPRESTAYVERVLSCHAARSGRATDHPNDPLRVEGVQRISVREAGPHLRISIAAADASTGRMILQRAKALRASPTQVEVKQVAAVDGVGASL